MNNPYTDAFGESLIRLVRDRTINHWDMILDGRMKGTTAQRVRNKILEVGLTNEQLQLLADLIPDIVDTSLHNLLVLIEQDKSIAVIQSLHDGNRADISNISDGLSGELYTEDGWIARFSKKR